jgi:hypothetical protein
MQDAMTGIVRELCAGTYGHVLRISALRELGPAFDIVTLACMDRSKLLGLQAVLEVDHTEGEAIKLKSTDKDVHIGDPPEHSSHNERAYDIRGRRDVADDLVQVLLAGRKTSVQEVQDDADDGAKQLAVDALRALNISYLAPAVVNQVIERLHSQ